ncbi:Bro-N domain-containing protein [Bodo saltans virus]|uniref:Bro-N domain-containing protein n=1 Tax=Bodo saltans virus TaxID=2024608 RepID=A0A2H4UUC4_9VIRU|nr:Bro-N domain-containing protein [Bodo saltans virus]ATZ80425.1 Bro-N domain-containing protein [Bodo saltans virus]
MIKSKIIFDSENENAKPEPAIGLKNKAITFAMNLFTFMGNNFAYVQVGSVFYFRAKDVAEFLGYKDTMQAIRKHVSSEDKITLEEILQGGVETTPPYKKYHEGILQGGVETTPPYKKYHEGILQGGVETTPPCKINKNDLKTIFLTEAGLYQLIFGSKKPEATDFKLFVTRDILKKIRKTGSYTLNSNCKYDETTELKISDKKEIESIKLKQKEVDLKQKEINLKQKEIDLEATKEKTIQIQKQSDVRLAEIQLKTLKITNKACPKDVSTKDTSVSEPICVVKRFINECTETSDIHTHTTNIYEAFVEWFKQIYPIQKYRATKSLLINLKNIRQSNVSIIIKNKVLVLKISKYVHHNDTLYKLFIYSPFLIINKLHSKIRFHQKNTKSINRAPIYTNH